MAEESLQGKKLSPGQEKVLTDKIMAARLRACREYRPYYARALFALPLTLTYKLDTMAVDKYWRMYWNPNFVNKYSVEHLCGVLIHEVEHLLRDHHTRRLSRHPEVWNIAVDFEINDDLAEQRIPLPEEGLFPEQHGFPPNLFGEQYYDLVKPLVKFIIVKIMDKAGMPIPGMGGGGSGSDGEDRPWEIGEPTDDAPGMSKSDADLVRRAVAEETFQHASKFPGSVPSGVARWAKQIRSPKVDWRREAATQTRNALAKAMGKSDYSYHRASRRQSIYGRIVMPSLFERLPVVVFVLDTSGSMTESQVEQGLGELSGVIRSVSANIPVTVLSVDAAVHSAQKVFGAEKVKLFGGGGTDMSLGIQAATELKPKPDIIIVFTDGYTGWPAAAPYPTKVVVCVCTEDGTTPPWAKTVRIPIDEKASATRKKGSVLKRPSSKPLRP